METECYLYFKEDDREQESAAMNDPEKAIRRAAIQKKLPFMRLFQPSRVGLEIMKKERSLSKAVARIKALLKRAPNS